MLQHSLRRRKAPGEHDTDEAEEGAVKGNALSTKVRGWKCGEDRPFRHAAFQILHQHKCSLTTDCPGHGAKGSAHDLYHGNNDLRCSECYRAMKFWILWQSQAQVLEPLNEHFAGTCWHDNKVKQQGWRRSCHWLMFSDCRTLAESYVYFVRCLGGKSINYSFWTKNLKISCNYYKSHIRFVVNNVLNLLSFNNVTLLLRKIWNYEIIQNSVIIVYFYLLYTSQCNHDLLLRIVK